MMDVEKDVRTRLLELRDAEYRAFQCKLMPTVNPETVIGVRTPALRALARELSATPLAEAYLNTLPHRFYDENNLHGFLVERIREYEVALAAVDAFLPYVDNWATCDLMNPKAFQKNLPALRQSIRRWMADRHPYTVRFGMETLMRFYLDDAFSPEYPEWVASVRSEEYYVNMMIAWYFATALAKQWEVVLPYLHQCRLDRWTHNKTIQKAVESNRVTAEQKAYLRTLKRK